MKNKGNIIIASTLVALFFLLHYYVYLDQASGEVPIIQSYTDAPVDLDELVLCEEKRPTYFNPFQKITYSYQVALEDTYSDCFIVEQAESVFTSNMKPRTGDPKDYWGGEPAGEGVFMRPQVGNTYANPLFFMVQYAIIGGFLFILLKPEKRT